jgi:antitoxin component of MazEF toxin-antitoxin module
MKFKTKLRKVGNSLGVLIPKDVITGYNEGDEIELSFGEEVITGEVGKLVGYNVEEEQKVLPVITEKKFNTEPCSKHPGSMKGTCGCK